MTPTILLAMLAAGGASLALSLLFTPLARRIARRIGFVDRPGGHKSHREPTPYGGGAAIFLSAWILLGGVIAASFALPDEWIGRRFGDLARALVGGLRDHAEQGSVILIGGLVLFTLGLVDDRRPLGPFAKLAVILIVALFVTTVGRVRIAEFAGDFASILLSVLWLGVIINAFNFLDNMDGLSAGVAALCMTFFAICGLMAGQIIIPAMAIVFLGAILGFLVFNFPPAKIFMGDAGSLLLGYMLAVVSILTSYWESGGRQPAFALAMPLVVLAVPLYDFTSVVIIRLFEGRNPFKGDQRHFSHRLVDRGLSRRSAVLTIYLATATTGLCATLLPGADLRETATLLAAVLMVLLIIAILEAPLRREEE